VKEKRGDHNIGGRPSTRKEDTHPNRRGGRIRHRGGKNTTGETTNSKKEDTTEKTQHKRRTVRKQ